MPGETRRAIFAQPDWLRRVPRELRLPAGSHPVFVGCGTSFHAAQTGGDAVQALEAVISPPFAADLMVCVSHEGGTPLTVEAARAFPGPKWLVTGARSSPLAELADEVVVCTPEVERSWCHTASYTCSVAAIASLRGEEIEWLADAVEEALALEQPTPEQSKILVAGAGRDWPTAQEAVLKLREGAWVSAGAHQTEQLLHGHLAAIDESVRAYVLEGSGRAAERAHDAVARRLSSRQATPSSTSSAFSSSPLRSPRVAASIPIRSIATTSAGRAPAPPTPSRPGWPCP
jgi:glucosamine--fructose-6-phosphate aminotransferase (isomerizing)